MATWQYIEDFFFKSHLEIELFNGFPWEPHFLADALKYFWVNYRWQGNNHIFSIKWWSSMAKEWHFKDLQVLVYEKN